MYTGPERRGFERIKGDLGVRHSPQGSDKEYYTVTKDISGSGIRIQLFNKFQLGTILDIQIFKRNSSVSTRCKGEIVWMSSLPVDGKYDTPFETGIKFIDQDLLCIGDLINDLDKRNVMVESLN
jgi:hypothetical protein